MSHNTNPNDLPSGPSPDEPLRGRVLTPDLRARIERLQSETEAMRKTLEELLASNEPDHLENQTG